MSDLEFRRSGPEQGSSVTYKDTQYAPKFSYLPCPTRVRPDVPPKKVRKKAETEIKEPEPEPVSVPNPVQFESNLMIFFHGLGDSDEAYLKLSKGLNLPQTASLSVCGDLPVPFTDNGWMYWQAFSQPDYFILEEQDPSDAVEKMLLWIETFVLQQWTWDQIHFFGFGQGSTLLLEMIKAMSLRNLAPKSAICINGQLMFDPVSTTTTPILGAPFSEREFALGPNVAQLDPSCAHGGIRLPKGDEWRFLMEFWAQHLTRRHSWEADPDLIRISDAALSMPGPK